MPSFKQLPQVRTHPTHEPLRRNPHDPWVPSGDSALSWAPMHDLLLESDAPREDAIGRWVQGSDLAQTVRSTKRA